MSRILAFVVTVALLFVACGNTTNRSVAATGSTMAAQQPKEVAPAVIVPIFDADSAYAYVASQVAFGPRVPNTAAHRACGDYLVSMLRGYGAEVVTQEVDLTAYNGDVLSARNIIASFQPEKSERLLLCAHWDCRPWADSDPDSTNHYKPILGANDGASGVGVLLEIARHLSAVPTEVGIDIVLFDAEDYGLHNNDISEYYTNTTSWALGSQYWSLHPHRQGYSARYGILLDIVGAPGSRFCFERYSLQYAGSVVQKVWSSAEQLGYSSYFPRVNGGLITDDHYYVNTLLGVPCIDIINCDPDSPNGFGAYHHTLKDDMDWIDASTLKAVGQTVMTVIYNEK